MESTKGIVLKSTGSWYSVKTQQNDIVLCNIRGKLRVKGIKSTNPVAVGDIVEFFIPDGQDTGVIREVKERKNYIVRKSINLSKRFHIIAANIDKAFLVVTVAYPETTTMFIDRFLLSAEAYRIPVVLVFNKIDIYNEKEKEKLKYYIDNYELAGYECIATSVETGENISSIKSIMKDKITVFSGHSGVGKSSLINVIQPDLNVKIMQISKSSNTGKHTTTFSEMHELSFGGYIIDTPGIKAYGIVNIEKNELFHFFPDLFKHSKNCQYYNCTHTHEPKCAVKKAVDNGLVSASRYNNYLEIFFDEDDKYRKPY
ncbi:MAG: ribosome small subunit-dependent GTPase A [Bacteroidales bacterium]|nr:ribosome small subunit-dependent GTPase A [Bacteroidales bacterium]